MATRHRSVDRSNACAAQKPEPRPGMPGARILPLKGVGSATPLRPRPGPSATMPVHATAARAGWVPSSRVTSRPDRLGALALRDDRAVIEIQILDRSCKPSLIRMPVPYRSWANKRCSPSRKPRMRTTSSGVSTTGKRRDGRGLPIS